jgi:ABC-type Co2+ transport system permease subunit
MIVSDVGALCFGLVIGWIVYRTLRRREGSAALSDIASVIGAVGGAAVTTVFSSDALFGWYSIGLAVGFAAYFIVGLVLAGREGKSAVEGWMGDP